ncbi:ABC transporter substrate-binding protein [Marinithermus hydrothermalis]|uniref:Extracellular ligand-binding receptor n=1 Tax=Marinithermus hydrothermalis (strain DSM 14884 / JCM 11576 / T1) TaxID=869210 RepID=F2NN49_MARHT|nr:ABC transporter substrate-binding protein [Marinithermus hydrothermalis]AEB12788.1 Extracellular ligand-binding receptor [Marinithermus hydrothermalis DSM 14884]
MRQVFMALAVLLGVALAQAPVKVGVLAPLSGFAAADGRSALTGIELAVEEINAQGGLLGRPVELVVYDDQADPKQAVNFARRLVELDKVAFVIGASYSGASLAAAPVVNEAGIPFIAAYAVAPDITRDKPYVFRMGLLGTVQGRVGAELAHELGAKRVAILTIQNDFGRALEAGFRERAQVLGLEIVYRDTYPLGNKNFTPILARLRAARPEVLYASAYFSEAANLVRQVRSLGMEVRVIGQEGYDSPKFIELAGDAAEGVLITTTLDRDSTDPAVQRFLEAYRERAGIPADMVGASGYAAMQVMALAAQRAGGLDGEALREALAQLEEVETVVGHVFYWTEDGDPVKTATVQEVREGRFRRFMKFDRIEVLKP